MRAGPRFGVAVESGSTFRSSVRDRISGRAADGFFPGAPDMIRERLGPLSAAARHQVLAGGAMGFYALQ
jgi:hypothetical protein